MAPKKEGAVGGRDRNGLEAKEEGRKEEKIWQTLLGTICLFS